MDLKKRAGTSPSSKPEVAEDRWFSDFERRQIEAHGLTESQVLGQVRLFAKPTHRVDLAKPCTIGDGIRQLPRDRLEHYIKVQEQAADAGRFMKFVPASGAASRMFHIPTQYFCQCETISLSEISQEAEQGDTSAHAFVSFCECLEQFAFFDDLKTVMWEGGFDIHSLKQEGRFEKILEFLLTEAGLNYQALPKGLLKFHFYEEVSRTALEEHLVEAAAHAQDQQGRCRLHFTILPEHQEKFLNLLRKEAAELEGLFECRFEIDFSYQSQATDTVAVDLNNRPFRDENGRLLFWPGGHGALLGNMNSLKGDLVYIKNIDNVVPDRLKNPTITWKKIMGGFLVELQSRVHHYLRRLTSEAGDQELVNEVAAFAETELFIQVPKAFEKWALEEQRDFLVSRLNRPMRVCGVVKNEGEPGGAPFWVREKDGTLSRQIVESAQVNLDAPEQQHIWTSSTHFNPVDLVCGLRDYQGKPFDLNRFVDPEAVFISRKTKNGKEFKVLELPGLWNGAMAHWLSVFIEVPLITFNPVKTVFDLLRPEHQPE